MLQHDGQGVKGSVWAESTCGPTRGVYTKPLLHSSLTLIRVHAWIQPIEELLKLHGVLTLALFAGKNLSREAGS